MQLFPEDWHKENECRKKIKEAANIAQEESEDEEEQPVMVANHALYAENSNIWIGDTGATNHMTNNDLECLTAAHQTPTFMLVTAKP